MLNTIKIIMNYSGNNSGNNSLLFLSMLNTIKKKMNYSGNNYSNVNQMSLKMGIPLIDKHDFTNKEKVIHNNLGDNLLSEHIIEYKIHINSSDRNTSSHPSPFKIKVPFGTSYPDPSISKKFKNVKYITLDSVIIPRTIAIDTTHINEPNLYPTESAYSNDAIIPTNKMTTLSNHRYLILKINELNSDNIIGTSILLDKDTFLLAPDITLGFDCVLWKPLHNYRIIYPNSLLHNINSLTFYLLDENGNDIHLVNQTGNKIIGTPIVGSDDYNKFVKNNESIASVEYTNGVTQVLYNLTFGVIETELNTNINY